MTQCMKAFALALLVLSSAVSAAETKQIEVPVIGESIDVRVVNVEVVATADGELVRGLTAADFRLLIDGKEVPIEFFTEVAEGTAAPAAEGPAAPVAAAEAVPRSYLVFIDESFSVAEPRNVVLAKLEAELDLMGPQDRMAVLAFNGATIDVLSPWTSDKVALSGVLRQARQREAQGNKALAQVRSLQADEDWLLEAAESGALEGDVVRLALQSTVMRKGPEARTQLGKTALAMAGTLRGFEAPYGRKVMLLLSGGWAVGVAPYLYGPVVSAANQLGYTLYPVDVASPTIETLEMLDSVAVHTGGRAMASARQGVFRQVVADSGSYYWLGFTPSWQANDENHSIRVESKRPGVAMRARTGFPDLSKKTENARKAESVLLFGGEQNDRKLKVLLGKVKPFGRKEIEVPVTVGVPVEALALTPSGKGYIAEAPLAVAALDGQGGRAEIPLAKLRVAIKDLPQAGGLARFQTTLRLRKAPQRLVFTVRDEVNGDTLWQEVELANP